MENGVASLIESPEKTTPPSSEIQYATVTSGVFEIPIESDGTLSLASIRAQLPGASGLWYWSNDGKLKKAIRYIRESNKLLPPYDEAGWGDKTYNVSYSTFLQPSVQKEDIERYEIASRLLQDSIMSMTRLTQQQPEVITSQARKVKVAYAPKESVLNGGSDQGAEQADVESEFISDLQTQNKMLEEKTSDQALKITELQNKYQDSIKNLASKNTEIETLKTNLEKTKKDFELLAAPSEGFGDPRFSQDIASLKKQLDDLKWKYGEIEGALQSKSRESAALHEWKREAENTINRLQSEHESCANRREKLEATVHALHQFALIMKREADMAKKRAGIDMSHRMFIDDDIISAERQEKIYHLEKDLDVTRDNLHRQTEEINNVRWRCSELESLLSVREKESESRMNESFHKETLLKAEIERLKMQLKFTSAFEIVRVDSDKSEEKNGTNHESPLQKQEDDEGNQEYSVDQQENLVADQAADDLITDDQLDSVEDKVDNDSISISDMI